MKLRKKEPELHRPFKVPFYPFFPMIALSIAIVSLAALIFYNGIPALIYFLILSMSYAVFKMVSRKL